MRYLIFLALSYSILTTNAFSNSVSEYISNLIPGEGDTEVSIDLRENYSPDYSILLVRELDRDENSNYFISTIQQLSIAVEFMDTLEDFISYG